MPGVRRDLGLAAAIAGGALAALGALDWYYAIFWGSGNTYCTGHVCYTIIAEPVPWYYLLFLPIGLVFLLFGIVLLVRSGKAGPAT